MSYCVRCYAKWLGIAGTAFFSTSAFASSPNPAIGEDIFAAVAILGAVVGALGAVLKVKAPRLLLRSMVVATILIFVVQLPMNGGQFDMAIVGAAILVVLCMICLSLGYGLVRLVIWLNSVEIR